MSRSRNSRSVPTNKVYRWVTATVGLFFVGLAVTIVCFSNNKQVEAYIGVLLIGGLGVDALVSAARNRQSILSRIGPLP